MENYKKLIFGSRGSKLALAQSRAALQVLQKLGISLNPEPFIIQTTADRHQEKKLSEIGGKGLFVKELEEALSNCSIDVAIHSLKDVPGVLPETFVIALHCFAEDRRDAFLSKKAKALRALPKGAVVGSSSPRRQAQILALRPDLRVKEMRGNVETRIQKMENGEVDAILLAVAGLNRLGLQDRITSFLNAKEFIPAVGQGILAMEILKKNAAVADLLQKKVHDIATESIARAERAFLAGMGGDCYSPIAAHAFLEKERLSLIGWVGLPDGTQSVRRETFGSSEESESLGKKLAQEILQAGGRVILEKATHAFSSHT